MAKLKRRRKKLRPKRTRRKRRVSVKKVTDGVVGTITDATLILAFYYLEFMTSGRGTSSTVIGEKAYRDWENFNYRQIRRALSHLKRKGLIRTGKESFLEPKITAAGRRRLESIVPIYDEKRTWDGIFYLVTYDIPRTHNRLRDFFRDFLRQIGCGPLQESVWVTPYNPRKLVEEFAREHNLEETILVSHMGKDGSVGGIELAELLEKVYGLSDLNQRYESFITEYEELENPPRDELLFSFLSILQDDPQLPFELLPEWWVGDEAYELFKSKSKIKG